MGQSAVCFTCDPGGSAASGSQAHSTNGNQAKAKAMRPRARAMEARPARAEAIGFESPSPWVVIVCFTELPLVVGELSWRRRWREDVTWLEPRFEPGFEPRFGTQVRTQVGT